MSPTAPDAPGEMTVDELRAPLAAALPFHAAFDGWTGAALARAAADVGVPPERARLAFPGGAAEMIDAWFASVDAAMAAALPPERIAAMKIRGRITALIVARLEAVEPHREALRRALAVLALPQHVAHGVRLGWRAADAMWRQAGDVSADFSHYTKRTTLAAVYGATLMALLDDDSDDFVDTRAFLDRRIAGVMRFETFKARIKPDPGRQFSPLRFLGRLRYPAV